MQDQILFTRDGQAYRASFSRIEDPDSLLRGIASSLPVVLRLSTEVSIQLSEGYMSVVKKVPHLQINTHMAPFATGLADAPVARIVPVWNPQTFSMCQSLRWSAPPGFDLYVVANYGRGRSDGVDVFSHEETFLVLVNLSAGSPRVFQPPIANLYRGNSKVCMGNNWLRQCDLTWDQAIGSHMDAIVAWINESRNNSDLAPSFDPTRPLIAWNPETLEQDNQFWDASRLETVSSSAYADIRLFQ